jgi:ubiquinone/menaquinone biosynthesis C-methylase UbiE
MSSLARTPAPALEAFSRQSTSFDEIDADNPIIARMRAISRKAALKHMRAGDRLLELNAGTGLDSLYFAAQGIRVLATDAASGMIQRIQAKREENPGLPMEVMECSFLDLHRLGDRQFQHVFSNFGGLNCTSHLDRVLKGIDRVLLPGGTCTLVIMPHFSPWEVLGFAKGHIRLAFRRFKRGGAQAHLEGVQFRCYYYSPRYVRHHLGPHYDLVKLRAMSLLIPPPHHHRFATDHPGLFRWLDRWEERIAHRWPFRSWGDHFLITLRKR